MDANHLWKTTIEGRRRKLKTPRVIGRPETFFGPEFFFIPPIVEVEVALFDTLDQVLLIFVQR